MRRLGLLGAYLLIFLTPAAGAVSATAPLPGTQDWASAPVPQANVSYSIWVVTGRQVVLRFLVPAWEAEAAMGRAPFLTVQHRLGNYLLEHTAVTASGRTCPAEDQGYDLGTVDPVSVGAGLYGFEIFFRCPVATGLVLNDSALFDRFPGHVNFARVTVNGQSRQELFAAGKTRLRLPRSGAPRPAPMGRYVLLGLRYLFQRLDWICFLIGAVALLAEGGAELWLAAGLASGLILSLVATLCDFIAPRSPLLLEAFVGFLVALPVARHISMRMERRRLGACAAMAVLFVLSSVALSMHRYEAAIVLAGAALLAGGMLDLVGGRLARLVWLLLPAMLLGIIEGLTLPQALRPLQLSPGDRLPMVSGFDFGSILGEVAVLLCAAGLSRGLSRKGPLRQAVLAADIAAAAIGALGMHQLVSRIYR